MEVSQGIRRLGNGTINSYLVEESGSITIVDAGVPGYWVDLLRELAAMGRSLGDVRALLLTHGHSDHIGYAERIRRERGVPVLIHELDAALARGEVPNPSRGGSNPIRPIPMLRFLVYAALRGAMRQPNVEAVSTFGDGATLDVPGAPRVTLVPGHTPGSAALHLPAGDAMFVGDAFATYSVTTGRKGPQVAPFTADVRQAVASLDRLAELDATIALPGHGDPWTGGVREAVRLVQQDSRGG